jgi:glycogen(starch) synthase
MPAIRRVVKDAHLVVAGRGSAREDLLRQVRSRRLSKAVTFEGWLPEEDLHALVAAADVVVVPSIYEPFGIVALEAAAVGTPVVAANSGGLAEVVQDGRTGWLFEAADPADLARCVIEALADPPQARRRARVSRQRVDEVYAWPRIARLTEEVYRDVLAGRRYPDHEGARAAYGEGPALHTNLLRAVD